MADHNPHINYKLSGIPSRALGILFSEELIGILEETGFSNSPQNLRPQDKNYSKCGREVGKLVGRRDLKCSGQVLDTCCHTDKCPPTQSQVLKKGCEVLGILLGKKWEMKLSLLSLWLMFLVFFSLIGETERRKITSCQLQASEEINR